MSDIYIFLTVILGSASSHIQARIEQLSRTNEARNGFLGNTLCLLMLIEAIITEGRGKEDQNKEEEADLGTIFTSWNHVMKL